METIEQKAARIKRERVIASTADYAERVARLLRTDPEIAGAFVLMLKERIDEHPDIFGEWERIERLPSGEVES